MRTIVESYPEFNTNLAAYTFIRDSILIQSLTVFESAKEVAKIYPILIHSADYIAQIVREHLAANKPTSLANIPVIDDSSVDDSSGSESDSAAVASPNRSNDIRQISRHQLSQALRFAGTSSTNSLSNIAQRSSQVQVTVPSTSGTSSTSAPSSAQSSASITNSFLRNALSQAILANSLNPETAPATATATATVPPTQNQPADEILPDANENHAERYANELQTMREMGLLDELVNVEALVVSNGNVEAAINLVLSGLGNLN